jgi:hypothetical protein
MPATLFNFLKNTKALALTVGSFPAAYMMFKGSQAWGHSELGGAAWS